MQVGMCDNVYQVGRFIGIFKLKLQECVQVDIFNTHIEIIYYKQVFIFAREMIKHFDKFIGWIPFQVINNRQHVRSYKKPFLFYLMKF